MLSLDNLFSVLNELYLNKYDRTAFVIPLFQFTRRLRQLCKTTECFENMILTIPNTTNELLQCVKQNICQIGNAHLKTHVNFYVQKLYLEICVKRVVASKQGYSRITLLPFQNDGAIFGSETR